MTPAPPLAVYLHQDKCGSSSLRAVMREAQRLSNNGPPWLCEMDRMHDLTYANVSKVCAQAEVVLGPAGYGMCSFFDRPCRYFTILREPVARMSSAYNYFCLSCAENGKLCKAARTTSANFNASCPNMRFLEFAAIFANSYTWRYSGRYTVSPRDRDIRADMDPTHYYLHSLDGFPDNVPLTESDLDAAREALNAPDMLVLKSEDLDGGPAWPRLERWLSGTRAAAALRRLDPQHAQQHSFVNVQSKYIYTPSAANKERACVINHFDCRLYQSLRSHNSNRDAHAAPS